MSNKMAPDLGKLDELAKVHALSYASPHHFTMSVNGLREVIAELQLPAGNKMALDALTAAKTQLEILLPDYGRVHDETEALAKIDAAIAALQTETQGWMPIETAPEKTLVVCMWLDAEDTEHPERYAFDFFDEDVWQNYFNEHEHYLIAGVAKGRSEDAPYTHWAPIPTPPKD